MRCIRKQIRIVFQRNLPVYDEQQRMTVIQQTNQVQENPDGWENIEYTCLQCDDKHHPDDRVESDVLIGVTHCPVCNEKRARVTHDLDGDVVYDDVNGE